MKRLPNKPSELIRLAIQDLELVERSKKYKIDMETWHNYNGNRCCVCFAGSVMAKTLEVSPTKDSCPHEHEDELSQKLMALDHFRVGEVISGLNAMNIETNFPAHRGDHPVEYKDDPKLFKLQMLDLSSILESEGL